MCFYQDTAYHTIFSQKKSFGSNVQKRAPSSPLMHHLGAEKMCGLRSTLFIRASSFWFLCVTSCFHQSWHLEKAQTEEQIFLWKQLKSNPNHYHLYIPTLPRDGHHCALDAVAPCDWWGGHRGQRSANLEKMSQARCCIDAKAAYQRTLASESFS